MRPFYEPPRRGSDRARPRRRRLVCLWNCAETCTELLGAWATMLFADKRNLETNLQVSLLKIRDKELQFYVGNCIASALARALHHQILRVCL